MTKLQFPSIQSFANENVSAYLGTGVFEKLYFEVLINKKMPSGKPQNEVTDLKEMYSALEI